MSPESQEEEQRLVVASNRLPVVLTREGSGDWRLEPGSGGLVTALEPVLRSRKGVWVGWPGTEEGAVPDLQRLLDQATTDTGYEVRGVPLTADEQDDFYLGFSNQVIWPLFHDFPSQCNFDPRFWRVYQAVNRKFARALGDVAVENDVVWVHDYHLMTAAGDLREEGVEQRLGFFLHIPFPPVDIFVNLPWRFQILRALLSYDLLGFQSARDRKNFLECVDHLVPDATVEGEGRVVHARFDDRVVRVGVFPVSIDFREFAEEAASDPVSERVARLRTEFPGQQIVLGVDRLDYSKGIPHKLYGYGLALERYPELRGKVTLVQLVVPSREDIPEYHRMKSEIERIVGEIQGKYTRGGWVPIHYQYGRWQRPELVAHYRAAAIALVTPLKDGMNVVAKEYCASSLEGDGVLILSEHAGATAQLQNDALLVNPYDVEEVARGIHAAFRMPGPERRARMERLRRSIRRRDIFWWVDTFMKALRDEDLGASKDVEIFHPRPPVEEG